MSDLTCEFDLKVFKKLDNEDYHAGSGPEIISLKKQKINPFTKLTTSWSRGAGNFGLVQIFGYFI